MVLEFGVDVGWARRRRKRNLDLLLLLLFLILVQRIIDNRFINHHLPRRFLRFSNLLINAVLLLLLLLLLQRSRITTTRKKTGGGQRPHPTPIFFQIQRWNNPTIPSQQSPPLTPHLPLPLSAPPLLFPLKFSTLLHHQPLIVILIPIPITLPPPLSFFLLPTTNPKPNPPQILPLQHPPPYPKNPQSRLPTL